MAIWITAMGSSVFVQQGCESKSGEPMPSSVEQPSKVVGASTTQADSLAAEKSLNVASLADLMQIVTDGVEDASGEAHWRRCQAAKALVKMGPVGIEPLLKVGVEDGVESISLALWDALEDPDLELRNAVRPFLERLSCSSDPQVRTRSVNLMRQLGAAGKLSVPALIRALDDPEGNVKIAAMRALGQVKPRALEAAPKLVELMKSKSREVRELAGNLLGLMKASSKEVNESLSYALNSDPDPWVRTRAARVLGSFGSSAIDAVPSLRQALKDSDEGVGQAAAEALEQIQGIPNEGRR